MAHGFICLTPESYDLLHSLNRKNLLSKEGYIEFEDCKTIRELENVLKKHLGISEEAIPKIFWSLAERWKWDRSNKDENTVFNEWQSIFIKRLLSHNGIYSREECQRETLTDRRIVIHVHPLYEDYKVIMVLQTRKSFGNKTIYFLNPEIIKGLKNGKS